MQHFETTVVGGGLAGLLAALALARRGRKVALIAPPAKLDRRTTALMDQSIAFLNELGLWPALEAKAAALSTMQIIDGTARLLRAPTVRFRAAEVGLSAFGYNFANAELAPILLHAIAQEPNIQHFEQAAVSMDLAEGPVTLTLADETRLTSDLVVGADGRQSMVRAAAGVDVRRWTYPQAALVLNFSHSRPHDNVSSEFHTEEGPFTQVPLPGDRSSLVWVMHPDKAETLSALSDQELSRRVEERMQSMLGKVTVETGWQVWPLSGMMAKSFGKGRLVFIGEAGHVFPPIGAQGLNLSLRDVMTLCELIGSGGAIAEDIGDRFHARRRTDIVSRTASVDLLNRSLLSNFLPVQMMRAAGLHLLASLPPLRQMVMREGVEPGRGFKSLPSILKLPRAS